MKKVWRSKLFLRYLVSYFVIFLVPFLVMGVILYQQSVVQLRSTIEESNMSKLKQLQTFFDGRVEELSKMASQISYDHRLTPYMVQHSYFGQEAIRELSKYQVNNAIIHDLYLYYPNSPYIYSSKGMASLDVFFSRVFSFSDWERSDFQKQMKALQEPLFVSQQVQARNERNERMLTLIYPIPPNTPSHHGVVMYFIKEAKLLSSMRDVLGDTEGGVFVMNNNQEVIVDFKNEFDGANGLEAIQSAEQGISSTIINKNAFSIMKVNTEDTGWSYVTVIPQNVMFSKLSSMKTALFFLAALLVMFGIVASYMLSLRNYRPVDHLLHLVQKKSTRPLRGNERPKNELTGLQEALESLFAEKDQMAKKYGEQEPFVLQQCLLQLLKGDHASKQQAETLLKQHGVRFKGKAGFVLLIRTENVQQIEGMISGPLQHIDMKGAEAFAVELVHDECVAYVVDVQQGGTKEHVAAIKAKLAPYWETMPALGVGRLYKASEGFHPSFVEAMGALEYTKILGKDNIFFADIDRDAKPDLWYSKEQQVRLVQSVKTGAPEIAVNTLQEMFTQLRTTNWDPSFVKCVCFDMINLVLRTSHEKGIALTTSAYALTSFSSISELERSLIDFTRKLCTTVQEHQRKSEEEIQKQVVDFIEANYCQHRMSLNVISESFQLTETNSSRLIKEWTGTTFTAYIWELRLKKAKERLQTSDESVKKIVKDIGYVDVANFTRKFKKTTGMTPGEYRQNARIHKSYASH
ncbi:AraC family transcriptional regulator [Aureibacillus halotolerans]|uniref:AraC-like DNA-binding protein n=1 Tax=Aureibacillus halotolerans TaxID=1508390 RepID=A0A4V3D4G4_9BACI|nr:AraC family transcriptional regulator [Aureibacillus halotolerans]TDQ36077.1 AraC-like DNA-binding protein [Aureibacillus halotolerans]